MVGPLVGLRYLLSNYLPSKVTLHLGKTALTHLSQFVQITGKPHAEGLGATVIDWLRVLTLVTVLHAPSALQHQCRQPWRASLCERPLPTYLRKAGRVRQGVQTLGR